jgi:hypothetical protein
MMDEELDEEFEKEMEQEEKLNEKKINDEKKINEEEIDKDIETDIFEIGDIGEQTDVLENKNKNENENENENEEIMKKFFSLENKILSKYFKLDESTINISQKKWKKILGFEESLFLYNNYYKLFDKFLINEENENNENNENNEEMEENSVKIFDIIIIILTLKSKKKITNNLINIIIKIISLIKKKKYKIPNINTIINKLNLNNHKIAYCGKCSQHIFYYDSNNTNILDKELICPNCNLVGFKLEKNRKKQIKIQPLDFIYHFSMSHHIINKILNCKNFLETLDYTKYKGKYFQIILNNFEKKKKKLKNNNKAILVIFIIHQDKVAFAKKSFNSSVLMTTIG